MAIGVVPSAAHDVVVAPHHVALPHEEDIHHAVVLSLRYGHNIKVLTANPDHLLVLVDDLHSIQPISKRRGSLKL